jgi:hypothetical protein
VISIFFSDGRKPPIAVVTPWNKQLPKQTVIREIKDAGCPVYIIGSWIPGNQTKPPLSYVVFEVDADENVTLAKKSDNVHVQESRFRPEAAGRQRFLNICFRKQELIQLSGIFLQCPLFHEILGEGRMRIPGLQLLHLFLFVSPCLYAPRHPETFCFLFCYGPLLFDVCGKKPQGLVGLKHKRTLPCFRALQYIVGTAFKK